MLRITHIGGVPVVDQEVAMGPHPRWPDEQVAYSGITYVLLEDGKSGFACEICGYMHEKIRSVASHLHKHNGKDSESTYPVELLRAVIRAVLRAKRDGHRDFMQRATADLNYRGIKNTLTGEPWNHLQVGRLFNKWNGKIKVQLPPAVPAQRQPDPISAAPAPSIQTEDTVSDTSLVRRLTALGQKLEDLSLEFEKLENDITIELGKPAIDAAEIAKLREKAARLDAIDPAIFDKAAKFDAAQSLFGNK